MAEMFDRQIDRWQMLADRVDAELTEVQKALVQAAARQKEMADEAAKLRQMKDQYLHDLAAQQQQDHSVEATTHLRRFLTHLDETLVAVEQQLRQMQAAKQKVEQRYRLLYQEHSKFEALRGRVEQRKDHHERRVSKNSKTCSMCSDFRKTSSDCMVGTDVATERGLREPGQQLQINTRTLCRRYGCWRTSH